MTRAAVVLLAASMAGAAARLEASCTVSSTGVSFGVYDVFSAAPTDTTGTITFRCANSDKNVRVSISRGASPTFTPRTLQNGAETLAYNLFLDATFAAIWGDDTGGTATYFNKNPPNANVNVTIFARIPALQDVSIGAYTDTVVVTIDY